MAVQLIYWFVCTGGNFFEISETSSDVGEEERSGWDCRQCCRHWRHLYNRFGNCWNGITDFIGKNSGNGRFNRLFPDIQICPLPLCQSINGPLSICQVGEKSGSKPEKHTI